MYVVVNNILCRYGTSNGNNSVYLYTQFSYREKNALIQIYKISLVRCCYVMISSRCVTSGLVEILITTIIVIRSCFRFLIGFIIIIIVNILTK